MSENRNYGQTNESTTTSSRALNMITISRFELYSHHVEEAIQIDQELIDDVLLWAKQDPGNWDREIKNYEDFLEALEKFYKDYEIHDPKLAQKIGDGEYYPGNDGHDWNHFDFADLDENEILMIEGAIKRLNEQNNEQK